MEVLDYVTVENVMPKEFCNNIIHTIQERRWQKHTWHSNTTNTHASEATKELDVQPIDQELQNAHKPFMVQAAKTYNTKFAGPAGSKTQQLVQTFTPIRFNRYNTGTMMRRHYDHIHSIFDGQRRGIPVLSFVGVYNDDYEGGKMIVRDKEFDLKTGDIIIMPSCFMYPHEVTEVTKGTRHSFVSCAF